MGEVKLINSKFITKFNDALKMSKYLYDKFFVSSSTIQHCLTLPPCLPSNVPPNFLRDPNVGPKPKQQKRRELGHTF
jgi:hypothetical protein